MAEATPAFSSLAAPSTVAVRGATTSARPSENTRTPATVDAQRDVVKNERRQSVENQPYGVAEAETLGEMLYPPGHPYHWPVIGYMPDLTAASYDDVVAFFKSYYAPSNASLVVAGDIDPAATRN